MLDLNTFTHIFNLPLFIDKYSNIDTTMENTQNIVNKYGTVFV